MKLLFDHHLSRKLVGRLADLFPHSSHGVFHQLERAEDIDIWLLAQQGDFTIISKDSDFNDITTLRGSPPKVIWLRVGNCTTKDVDMIIRNNYHLIERFIDDDTSSILEVQ